MTTATGTFTFEIESWALKTDDACLYYLYERYEIGYSVWPESPMVMYLPDGSGYPGHPAGCEWFDAKCVLIESFDGTQWEPSETEGNAIGERLLASAKGELERKLNDAAFAAANEDLAPEDAPRTADEARANYI